MVKPEDTEEKREWHKYGEAQEIEFLENIAPKLSADIKLNPEKKKDPSAIDLIMNGRLCDLKKQETPFFKAGKYYDIDPQYCVTFNTKDYWNYTTHHSPKDVDILFWVNWQKLEMFGIPVQKMHGVWFVNMSKIKEWVDNDELPTNDYIRRVHDLKGNAKTSYLMDLRKMKLLALF
jgi:hypothetical protein